MSKVNYYSYADLRKAVNDNPTEENINALGEWFERYGGAYWNGWYYDADGIRLAPIYEQTGEDDFDLIGWQLAD